MGDDPFALLDEAEAAALLGTTGSSLARWRKGSLGPPFIRLGRRVRYRRSDLAEWLASRVGTQGGGER